MAFLNPLSNAFGLDIGDNTFKVVQMVKRGHSAKPYRLKAWGSIGIAEGVMEKGEVLNMAQAVQHVHQLLSQTHGRIKGRGVVACLPEAKSFVKIVEVGRDMNESQIRQLIIKEIEQNFPLKIDEIYYDWQVIESPPAPKAAPAPARPEDEETDGEEEKEPEENAEEGGTKAEDADEEEAKEAGEKPAEPKPAPPEEEPPAPDTKRVLLAAAPRNLIDDYTQMMELAGLAPIAFEIEAVAIARAIVPAEEQLTEAIGILDIGATRSSLIIYDEGILQMSISIPISGIELTKIISEKLNIGPKDAELVKIECGLDAHRCEDRMWKILLPIIDDMSAKIRNALRFYKIGFPLGKKIERMYLCGGGAHFREIDTVLSRKLTIKVRRGDALVNIRQPRSFPEDSSLTFATAIGLAMRATDESARYRSSFRR